MKSMADLLEQKGHHVVDYLMFCVNDTTYRSKSAVKKYIINVREALAAGKKVVFISWEHHKYLDFEGTNFLGFQKILGPYYDTNRWAVCVPTFGDNQYGERQFCNLDFLVMMCGFNTDYSTDPLDHSNKKKDFLYLNGKPHQHRIKLFDLLIEHNLLENSLWSNASLTHSWGPRTKKLDEEYEIPEWRGLLVDAYDSSTRRVYAPQYNATTCSIVPETLIDDNCHYITEKTLKPILAEHIFVVLAGSGYLRNLRTFGFKTFREHFDESYDECQDLDKRMLMIVDTLKQIKQMDTVQLYSATSDIRRHNRELLLSSKLYDDFNRSEYTKIEQYFNAK